MSNSGQHHEASGFTTEGATVLLRDVFERSWRRFPNRTAIVGDDGRSLTYGQLDRLSGHLAGSMQARGMSRQDRIAVLSEPTLEFGLINVAAARIGVAIVGLNTRYVADEIARCVDDSSPHTLFFDPAHAETAEVLRDTRGGVDFIEMSMSGHSVSGHSTVEDLVESAAEPEPVQLAGSDIHSIIYTSGTTGTPKGAMISQAAAAVRAYRICSWFSLGEEDAFLGWLPMFHTGGDEPFNATLMSGGRFMTFRRADPHLLVEAIDRQKATWTWLLPGMFAEFLAAAADSPLSSLRFGGGYGNLLPQRLIDELVEKGPIFYDLFGQTEVSLLIASNRIVSPGESEWRKTPTPLLHVSVVDENGFELPPGSPGECVCRGPSVMSGYLNQPSATKEVFRGGVLHTGDILTMQDDGTLVFTDRQKYLIKTGGENVYPAEVEAVLLTHPGVAEVCVAGVPDERWGETVKAFVVTRSDYKLSRTDLNVHCGNHLAGFKRPRFIEFVSSDEVPRSATGKVVRAALLDRPLRPEDRVETLGTDDARRS